MFNILCGGFLLTLMKTGLTLCQQVVEVHEEGYEDLMEEGGTYCASGVIWGILWGGGVYRSKVV